MFVQTSGEVTAAKLESALAGPHVTVTSGRNEFPSNVNIAGSSEILASVRPDGAGGMVSGYFAACDNLRVFGDPGD